MKFELKDVIQISEYVRVATKSTPKVKTIDIINEFLEVKNEQKKQDSIEWWNRLPEKTKWNLTTNHLVHWEDLEDSDILKLYEKEGY
jgi:hypothetical protein